MNEPILYAGLPRIPPPSMQIRSRREPATRDAVNARIFEEWQTDPPTGSLRDMSGVKVLLDMNPIPTRTTTESYKQSQSFVPTGPQMGMNPYFDRYDPTFDPRNAVRELRSAVYEDKGGERGISEARHILQRGYTTRWLPEGYVEINNMDTLKSFETLRPQMNNMAANYVNQKSPAR